MNRHVNHLARATLLVLSGVVVTVAVSPAFARSHNQSPAKALVKKAKAHILVSSTGRTLYVFAADAKDKSNCTGQCAAFWPPVTVPSGTTPPAKVAGIRGTFGAISRDDGTQQLTYDGAPLYTFAQDKKKGQMNGQGLFAAGGYWWVVVVGGK